jgi:hypothetical protein
MEIYHVLLQEKTKRYGEWTEKLCCLKSL